MGTVQALKTKSEVRGKGLQIMGQFLSRHSNDIELECLGKFADSHKWPIYTFHRELQGRDQCDWWVLFDSVLVQAMFPTLDCTHGGHEEHMVSAQRFTIRWLVLKQAVFFIGDLTTTKKGAWKVAWRNLLFKALFFATKNKQYVVTPLVGDHSTINNTFSLPYGFIFWFLPSGWQYYR